MLGERTLAVSEATPELELGDGSLLVSIEWNLAFEWDAWGVRSCVQVLQGNEASRKPVGDLICRDFF